MPDPIFAHPRLAAVYDMFDGDRTDLDAYLRIAGEFEAPDRTGRECAFLAQRRC